jgi:hypothetical protein
MSALPKLAALVLALLPAPNVVDGWVLQGEPRIYSGDTLYEYIDGNADLFHSYGFRQAGVGDYVPAEGDGWISVDVYDMGAPLHAFGVYSAERPPGPELVRVGVQGYAASGLLAFWDGPYYVKVSLIDGDDFGAARALAQVTDQRIRVAIAMPPELSRLPMKKRVAGTEQYVKKSALGHEFLVEVVSADYAVGDAAATLYIADLGSAKKAAAGLQKLSEFEASSGERISDIPGVGEDSFAASDPYYGELAAAWQGRFVYVAISEDADRAMLGELLCEAISAVAVPAAKPPPG